LARLRVLVIGYNAFDVLLPHHGFPEADKKHEMECIFMGGGGPGATAAVALSKLGAEVTLITPLCGDVPGQIQEQELLAAGVNLDHSPRHPHSFSPKAVIFVDTPREERTIFWSRGDLPPINADKVNLDILNDMDMLYTDGHETKAALKLALGARERGLPVIMDAGSVRKGSAELVAKCTDVISSSEFAPALTNIPDPRMALLAMAKMGPLHVGLTQGAKGVLGVTDGKIHRQRAFDVPVLDTTGAGDVFHAGYAFARGTGMNFADSLDFGNATAALKCRGWGGRSNLPDQKEVTQLIFAGKRK